MSFDKEELEDFDKLFGKGTTILSHIYRDIIFIVSDGRRCSISETKEGLLLLQGDDKKIYKINNKICCSTAGNVELCNNLKEITENEAHRSRGDAHKIMTELMNYRKKLLKDKAKKMVRGKKKEKDKPMFEAQFTVYTSDGMRGGPLIQQIGKAYDTSEYEDLAIVPSGSGGEDADAYFKRLLKKRPPGTIAERLLYMKVSVAAMSLIDKYTGGFVQGATLSPEGLDIQEHRDHVIKLIAENFLYFEDLLKTKLLCISRNFSYNLENEEVVTTFLNGQFPKVGKLILGVHGQVIVRTLDFPDNAAAGKAFERKGGRECQLDLKRNDFRTIELKRPIQSEFRYLARFFVDRKDL